MTQARTYCLWHLCMLCFVSFSCNKVEKKDVSLPSYDYQVIDTFSNEDTLLLYDDSLTIFPLGIGNEPIVYFKSFQIDSTIIRTYFNRHVEGQVDTLFSYYLGIDIFSVHKVNKDNWIVDADINSANFPLKNGIVIGMTKDAFAYKMSHHRFDSLPNYVHIENPEILENLFFTFRNDSLHSIYFSGYVD